MWRHLFNQMFRTQNKHLIDKLSETKIMRKAAEIVHDQISNLNQKSIDLQSKNTVFYNPGPDSNTRLLAPWKRLLSTRPYETFDQELSFELKLFLCF